MASEWHDAVKSPAALDSTSRFDHKYISAASNAAGASVSRCRSSTWRKRKIAVSSGTDHLCKVSLVAASAKCPVSNRRDRWPEACLCNKWLNISCSLHILLLSRGLLASHEAKHFRGRQQVTSASRTVRPQQRRPGLARQGSPFQPVRAISSSRPRSRIHAVQNVVQTAHVIRDNLWHTSRPDAVRMDFQIAFEAPATE